MVQEKNNKVIDSDDEVSPTRTKPTQKILFMKAAYFWKSQIKGNFITRMCTRKR